jgi:hypothetical protein
MRESFEPIIAYNKAMSILLSIFFERMRIQKPSCHDTSASVFRALIWACFFVALFSPVALAASTLDGA